MTPRPEQPPDGPVGEIVVASDELQRRVRRARGRDQPRLRGRRLLLIGILKGAVLFLADLMRSLRISCEVDFMAVSSYGSSTDSSGVVRILKDLDSSIEGRDVLIVEDIIDSGLTLHYLIRNLRARGPRSLEVCALLDQARTAASRPPDSLRGVRDPGPLRGRIRARLRAAVSQPRVRRRVGEGGNVTPRWRRLSRAHRGNDLGGGRERSPRHDDARVAEKHPGTLEIHGRGLRNQKMLPNNRP